MSAKSDNKVYITACLCSNLFFSISIVLINKWIFKVIGFPNLTLTLIHFLITSIGLIVASKVFRLFKIKSLPLTKMLPLSFTFCGFVVFTNLSLLYNTVGTYQVYKSLTMPCIVVIQALWYQQTVSSKVKVSLGVIIVGVILSSYYDLQFSKNGVTYAMLGVLVTSLYQIWVSERQKDLQVNSVQLLVYQAPLSAFWLLFVLPIFEPPGAVLSRAWTFSELTMVLLSGLFALMINITIFAIIGNTSPMTYNVFGQLKFGLTVVGGFLIFKDEVYLMQLVGIFLTWTGIAFYTVVKLREETMTAKTLPLTVPR